MIQTIKIEARLQWVFSKDPHTGRFVAECTPLRLSMGGDTQTELHENIAETLNLLFASLVEDGQFEQFLRDHGWRASPMPSSENVAPENVRITVPWELVAAMGNAHGSSSRAHN